MNYPKLTLGWLLIQGLTWFIIGMTIGLFGIHVTMRDLVFMLAGSVLWFLIALSWKHEAETTKPVITTVELLPHGAGCMARAVGTKCWGAGKGADEAIGSAIRTDPSQFNLDIEDKRTHL